MKRFQKKLYGRKRKPFEMQLADPTFFPQVQLWLPSNWSESILQDRTAAAACREACMHGSTTRASSSPITCCSRTLFSGPMRSSNLIKMAHQYLPNFVFPASKAKQNCRRSCRPTSLQVTSLPLAPFFLPLAARKKKKKK